MDFSISHSAVLNRSPQDITIFESFLKVASQFSVLETVFAISVIKYPLNLPVKLIPAVTSFDASAILLGLLRCSLKLTILESALLFRSVCEFINSFSVL